MLGLLHPLRTPKPNKKADLSAFLFLYISCYHDILYHMKNNDIIKYPRTQHIESSGLQSGDEDLDIIPFSELKNKRLVIEEKIDGANCGISFNYDCDLLLQSRGHFLMGSNDKIHFDPLKVWAKTWQNELFYALSDRYIMYGEWMYALHSVFYDLLPHYFMEFDIFDKKEKVFLDTEARQRLITEAKLQDKISSVKVVGIGNTWEKLEQITNMVGKSHFISENAIDILKGDLVKYGVDENVSKVLLKLNESNIMEGLYIKWEENGIVRGRYKFVRGNFVQSIKDSNTHWMDRKIIPNRLMEGVSMYV